MHVNKISWAQSFWVPVGLALVTTAAMARPLPLTPASLEGHSPEALRVERAEQSLSVSWSTDDEGSVTHRIHVGTLRSLLEDRRYDHAPACHLHRSGAAFTEPSTDSYFLVVPVKGGLEGLPGRNSAGELRPPSSLPCR